MFFSQGVNVGLTPKVKPTRVTQGLIPKGPDQQRVLSTGIETYVGGGLIGTGLGMGARG